jgi:Holliday junction resolvase-like predicted endonuclease
MGELDFVVEYNGEVLPIEVKSGKDYQVHSALSNVLKCTEYKIDRGIVFNNYNVSKKGNIVYYPVYMVMFLKNDDVELPEVDYKKLSF